jgi:hypothetical protein
MIYLDEKKTVEAFGKVWLEGQYDFLLDDLVKLANAFAVAAAPEIAKEERKHCVSFVRSLNSYVAQALEDKRGGERDIEVEVDSARRSGLL